MDSRAFGSTGLSVSAVGFGAGHIGDPALDEHHVGHLLNAALDAGVTLVDTARGYGLSEERIGRHLSHRRDAFVLSSKCGYGIPGHEDWTPGCITAGVDHALRLMRTDRIDVMHLHSCPLEVLRRPGLVEALQDAVRAGKVRVAAYAGEGEALDWAVASGAFGSIQTSVSLLDQNGLGRAVAEAARRGLGVIAKRPLANAPWRFAERPAAHDVGEYWDRLQQLALPALPRPLDEVALRFSAFSPGVSAAIVGTSRLAHLEAHVRAAAAGPLPADWREPLEAAFRARGAHWPGLI
jgi:aryl-alcohol dehydrogenase-like predicted oxidoreductase